jgi:hypothetical protein
VAYLLFICSMSFTPCGEETRGIALAAGIGFILSATCFAVVSRSRAGGAIAATGLVAAFVVSAGTSTRVVLLAVDVALFATVAVALGGWLPSRRAPSDNEEG